MISACLRDKLFRKFVFAVFCMCVLLYVCAWSKGLHMSKSFEVVLAYGRVQFS